MKADALQHCLAVLDEIRKHPVLAPRVAEAYEDQRNKLTGVDLLLAGALLVLAVRVKSVAFGKTKMDFYEASEAIQKFLVKLVGGDIAD